MKPAPFQYHAPTSLEEALGLLLELPGSMALAGGQSLMPALNQRLARADHLVDLAYIPGLTDISEGDDFVRLGAMVSQGAALRSHQLGRLAPLAVMALRHVGHRATRNRGTIGGSIAQLAPGAELPAAALAHDALLEIAGQGGARRGVSFADFAQSEGAQVLGRGELLINITLPAWSGRYGAAFLEASPRPGSPATVCVAALVGLGESRTVARAAVAVAGLQQVPVRAHAAANLLIGQTADSSLFEAAAQTVDDLPVRGRHLASERHRRRLARALVRRALDAATEHAMGQPE